MEIKDTLLKIRKIDLIFLGYGLNNLTRKRDNGSKRKTARDCVNGCQVVVGESIMENHDHPRFDET